MNHIILETISDLNMVIDNPIHLTRDAHKAQNNDVVLQNTWAIALSPTLLSTINLKDLERFIHDLIAVKQKQITALGIPATLYVWFEEMAAHLCFNIIAGHQKELPFGCTVVPVKDPKKILKAYISSPYHAGIPTEEFEDITSEPDLDEDDDNEYVLPVFSIYLNP
jgi:hypothetical protein